MVPRELFGNASTWNSLAWQTAAVTGPAIGGLIYGFSGIGAAYIVVVCLTAVGFVLITFVSNKPLPEQNCFRIYLAEPFRGIKICFSQSDCCKCNYFGYVCCFFGGAVSVLPIFADQILHIGAEGLGLLRAAPAVGAIIMSIFQAYHPFFKSAGRTLLICVLGFGLSMISFAISKNFYISLFVLMISGMFDNVSVIMRSTIIQLYTPDEMRGRVSCSKWNIYRFFK